MAKKLKIAIAGAGRWGSNLIAEFSKQTEIGYFLYKGSEKTRNFLEQNYPGIPTTQSIEKIINDTTIDAVVIATPTSTHFNIALQCLRAKKHVFLEKPGGTNSAELEILCKASEENQVTLFIGYIFAHHPVLKKLKEIIDITDLKAISFEWNKWGTFEEHSVPHLLSHDISILLALGIRQLAPTHYQQEGMISDSDIIDVSFQSHDHLSITSRINRISTFNHKSVTLIGKNKSYICSGHHLFAVNDNAYTPIEVEQSTAVSQEIKAFISDISENKKPLTDGWFAVAVFKVIESINYR